MNAFPKMLNCSFKWHYINVIVKVITIPCYYMRAVKMVGSLLLLSVKSFVVVVDIKKKKNPKYLSILLHNRCHWFVCPNDPSLLNVKIQFELQYIQI